MRARYCTGRAGWIWFLGTMCFIDWAWPEDEMLSRAFDRFRTRHPFIAHYFVIATALHLLRLVPPPLDMYQAPTLVGWLIRRARRATTRIAPLWDAVHDPLSVEVDR